MKCTKCSPIALILTNLIIILFFYSISPIKYSLYTLLKQKLNDSMNLL